MCCSEATARVIKLVSQLFFHTSHKRPNGWVRYKMLQSNIILKRTQMHLFDYNLKRILSIAHESHCPCLKIFLLIIGIVLSPFSDKHSSLYGWPFLTFYENHYEKCLCIGR